MRLFCRGEVTPTKNKNNPTNLKENNEGPTWIKDAIEKDGSYSKRLY